MCSIYIATFLFDTTGKFFYLYHNCNYGATMDFEDQEFDCKCGCGLGINDINPGSVRKLCAARLVSNVPYILNSAVRCPSHNKKEGGSNTSSHLPGPAGSTAFDIKATTSHDRFMITKGLILAGFNRIGVRKDFIHADDDPNKPPELEWLY